MTPEVMHLAELVGRDAKIFSELPIIILRVGDIIGIAEHNYTLHYAGNGDVVLGPTPPKIEVTVSIEP